MKKCRRSFPGVVITVAPATHQVRVKDMKSVQPTVLFVLLAAFAGAIAIAVRALSVPPSPWLSLFVVL